MGVNSGLNLGWNYASIYPISAVCVIAIYAEKRQSILRLFIIILTEGRNVTFLWAGEAKNNVPIRNQNYTSKKLKTNKLTILEKQEAQMSIRQLWL